MSGDSHGNRDLWVFGYGSLMWRPGFAHAASCRARIHGYRRRLCIYCEHHRGTPARPGLVFGLDRGGSCVGLAFRVPGAHRAAALAYLRRRELRCGAYRERHLGIRLESGESVQALCYTANHAHAHYAGSLSPPEAAGIVARANGPSGANRDYMLNTLRHLGRLGITDPWLAQVARLVDASPAAAPVAAISSRASLPDCIP
ncbi:gamma-glutamylcyclotransferase [Stappia sp.]|uniref:gamma-glutamylcyclotransferase n=1 Tax=Stappia sp. TaxID=1870903 RepID=UPI003D0F2A16